MERRDRVERPGGDPAAPGRSYSFMLYRHGYQQITGKLSVEKSGEAREFVLTANALFKGRFRALAGERVHRRRAGRQDADRGQAGHAGLPQRTPHLRRGLPRLLRGDGVQQEGGEPQGGPAEGLSQDRRAGAGEATSTARSRPTAPPGASTPTTRRRRRLGNIYLDDKEDYDRAIAEFETVLALPENERSSTSSSR